MGGGASSVARYSLKVSNVPPKLTSSASQPLLEQHRKPTLKRSNSDPKVLTDNTIFSPYVDLNIGHRGSAKVIQRAISQSKSTLIGEGKLDYKRSDFYELSSKYPWLLKNAHFVQPQLRDFIVGRIIGYGRFAKVHIARTSRNKYFALKVYAKSEIFRRKDIHHILGERQALYEINHPFCMKLFSEFEDKEQVYFALEFVCGGSLRSRLLSFKYNRFPIEVAKFYLIEIFSAVEYMHNLGFVHRDLRPENVLIDEEGHIKLIDFGHAARLDSNINRKLYTICCSPSYLSPELLNSKYTGGYAEEVDWWAFGVMIYETIVGGLPFGDAREESMYEILLKILNHQMKIPFFLDRHVKDILARLFEPNLTKRLIQHEEIKKHSFFREKVHSSEPIDWQKDVLGRRLLPPYIPLVEREGDTDCFQVDQASVKQWKLQGFENQIQLT